MTPGPRHTPPAIRQLFGPLLPLPDGARRSAGRFRCVACPAPEAVETADDRIPAPAAPD